MSTNDHLARMANQIAANLAAQGEEAAIAETVEHLRRYWDPAMRASVMTVDPGSLSPIARAAMRRLARA